MDRVRVRAPELRAPGGAWIGSEPLTLEALRGRVVLLDFWTLACVNCMRVVEELRALERRFPELVVIGIHSPKFPHEHEHDAVRAAVDRHRIAHPVLDDPGRVLWDAYGVRAWPTLVLIDPSGRVALTLSGEGHTVELASAIEALGGTEGTVPSVPPEGTHRIAAPERGTEGTVPYVPSELRFPGKVVGREGRVVIADTGNDRVLEIAGNGEVLAEHAGLYQPQGVRFDDDGSLLVCETGADRVWRLRDGRRELIAEGLRSPWDVVRWRGHIVVAEAGSHRLMGIDAAGEIQVVAGRAFAENLLDGPAHEALLAQPSGLAVTAGGDLAFVDAESSALRVLDAATLEVRTLVGLGLFTSGDADGDPENARLQHPLGIAAAPDGALFIADTFNGLLRVWRGRHLWTVPVEGFAEPGGLDVLGAGALVVADTANHRVVVVDPFADPAVAVALDVGRTVAEPVVLTAGDPLPLPKVAHGELDAGTSVRVTAHSALLDEPVELAFDDVPESLALDLDPGAGRVTIELELATCAPDACRLERIRHAVDVIVG